MKLELQRYAWGIDGMLANEQGRLVGFKEAQQKYDEQAQFFTDILTAKEFAIQSRDEVIKVLWDECECCFLTGSDKQVVECGECGEVAETKLTIQHTSSCLTGKLYPFIK